MISYWCAKKISKCLLYPQPGAIRVGTERFLLIKHGTPYQAASRKQLPEILPGTGQIRYKQTNQ